MPHPAINATSLQAFGWQRQRLVIEIGAQLPGSSEAPQVNLRQCQQKAHQPQCLDRQQRQFPAQVNLPHRIAWAEHHQQRDRRDGHHRDHIINQTVQSVIGAFAEGSPKSSLDATGSQQAVDDSIYQHNEENWYHEMVTLFTSGDGFMRAVDIIRKKRDGQALSDDEINWFIDAYTRDDLPDYQAAALLMAILLRGMDTREVTTLTLAMAHSGDQMDLSAIAPYVVDKHSSGGVGDKVSLVVLPLVAACGVPVAKMSGRGLGHTGGTLDKLEAIAGFNINLSERQFTEQAQRIGLVLCGQTKDLAPADGKLYALRDVTATVPSIPLIASSIMSKKLAAGASGIVLDVKVGSGAFMKDLDSAAELSRLMIDIGQRAGRDVVALLSDMNQPLGEAVGNALEVAEAIEALRGGGPADLREHCLEVAAHMLRLAGRGESWTDIATTKVELAQKLDDGAALAKFGEMVAAQGGDMAIVGDPQKLPQARSIVTMPAERGGIVQQAAADAVAQAAFELGAGREKKGDSLDLAVGVRVHVNVGDTVEAGQPLATIHANDPARLDAARDWLTRAVVIGDEPAEPLPLFYDVLGI